MSKNAIKDVRKQLKNIFQDLAPTILTQELCDTIYKKLQAEQKEHLTKIENNIKEVLQKVDDRSKDMQSYMVRASIDSQARMIELQRKAAEEANVEKFIAENRGLMDDLAGNPPETVIAEDNVLKPKH